MEVRFTLKGYSNEIVFTPIITLEGNFYLLGVDGNNQEVRIPIKKNESNFFMLQDESCFEEPHEIIAERLLGLSEEWIENDFIGIEPDANDVSVNQVPPGYTSDEIFVENKPFSLQQLMNLIDAGDIELSPNFQRNFIWDNTRQSRLVESIFMGLPLPSIYLSQYEDGRLTIVDGLQRVYTIRKFFKNELRLSNMEYFKECNGHTYEELKNILSPLRLRRFGQTAIMCFVIDYRSPQKLKYDLFRRLNTGGKPLNNQEIRNCLSRLPLQKALRTMVMSEAFRDATDGSVKDIRMDAQECALRYMYFYDQYSEEKPIGNYDGYMDSTLNAYVDYLNRFQEFDHYISTFEQALIDARILFGKFTFRKVVSNDLAKRRTQVNKLLMLAVLVLLAKHKERYEGGIKSGVYLTPYLIELMAESNRELFNALTWSTNAKANIDYVMRTLKEKLFDKYLII